ncbi:hypothetical protein [Hoeflea sp.]|uniref:hypothetical protein n=1 Tax=Hoeflea sp. TaxID=1940281 RepID=UPI003B01AFA1
MQDFSDRIRASQYDEIAEIVWQVLENPVWQHYACNFTGVYCELIVRFSGTDTDIALFEGVGLCWQPEFGLAFADQIYDNRRPRYPGLTGHDQPAGIRDRKCKVVGNQPFVFDIVGIVTAKRLKKQPVAISDGGLGRLFQEGFVSPDPLLGRQRQGFETGGPDPFHSVRASFNSLRYARRNNSGTFVTGSCSISSRIVSKTKPGVLPEPRSGNQSEFNTLPLGLEIPNQGCGGNLGRGYPRI